MAINPEDLTINFSFRKMLAVPKETRDELASSGVLDQFMNQMTPTQMALLFPDYFTQPLPDVMFKGSGTSGFVSQRLGLQGAEQPTYQSPERTSSGGPGGPRKPRTGGGRTGGGTGGSSGTTTSEPPTLDERQMKILRDKGLLATPSINLSGELPQDRKGLIKAAMQAAKSVGLSDKQAAGFIAEINRENSFNPNVLFGSHSEPGTKHTGRKNAGMLSWAGPRRTAFEKHMREAGLMDENGSIPRTYEALVEQFKFSVQKEMPQYKSGREFLANRDISKEDSYNLLGKGYVVWDVSGKNHPDRRSYQNALNRREQGYNEALQAIGELEDVQPSAQEGQPETVELNTARAEAIRQAVPNADNIISKLDVSKINGMSEEQFGALVGELQKEKAIPSEQKVNNTVERVSGAVSAIGDSRDQWGFEPGRNAKGVDPRLVESMKLAAERFPLRVRFFSGTERGKGEHGAGMAGDVAIYDEAGHPLSSYQDPRTMNAYAMYWQRVHEAATELHGKEYADKLAWLGGEVRASGAAMPRLGEAYNPDAYGTGDSMDIRYNRKGINFSEAFKVNEGWNEDYAYYTEEDYFGIGAKKGKFEEEDYAKLAGFRLTEEQKKQMADRAKAMRSNSGYFKRLQATGGGIGERQYPTQTIASNQQNQPYQSIVQPNTINPNLPGGEEAMAAREDLAGVVFHQTPLTLEQLQAGEDPRAPTFGYNTAIISNYIDKDGNKISEQEWNKLPKSKKQLYTEKAEVHQIRPEDVRPNQIRKTTDADTPRVELGKELNNPNALGVVAVGRSSPEKARAGQEYLAELIATGKMKPEALQSIYGHGEIQPNEGRATMDKGKRPEGHVIAAATRANTDKILQRAEEIKAQLEQQNQTAEQQPPKQPEDEVKPLAQGDASVELTEPHMITPVDGTGQKYVAGEAGKESLAVTPEGKTTGLRNAGDYVPKPEQKDEMKENLQPEAPQPLDENRQMAASMQPAKSEPDPKYVSPMSWDSILQVNGTPSYKLAMSSTRFGNLGYNRMSKNNPNIYPTMTRV